MNESDNPKVSVIITTYNRADLLPRAVNSVLSQTFEDYEVIIVDDCSTDHTQEVIAKFADSRIRPLRHEVNRGASAARNTGIANALGEYIAFLDDDDELTPNSVMGRVTVMEESPPEVGMCYGSVSIFDDSTGATTSIHRGQWFLQEEDMTTRCLALESPTSTLTIVIRASVAREVGGFDSRYANLDDMNFSCRVSLRYRIVEFPEVVAIQHISHGHYQITQEHTDLVSSVYRHITDFEYELSRRPEAHAATLFRLAIGEMMVRRRVSSLRNYWKAATVIGLSSRLVLRPAPHLFRVFLWYATPLSGLRDTARKFRNRLKTVLR